MVAALLLAAALTEPIVGGPCEGCEAVFQGRPATIGAVTRLVPAGEKGEPMVLSGIVRRADGSPASGILVYAYQTNAAGIYPTDDAARGTAAHRHGRLRGFARTAGDGSYRFDSIRPGGYPGTSIPQHVHMHVIEPGRCTYWIDDVVFDDDPRLTPSERRSHDHGRGGPGLARPSRTAEGTWLARRDIVLGAGIEDYGRCGVR